MRTHSRWILVLCAWLPGGSLAQAATAAPARGARVAPPPASPPYFRNPDEATWAEIGVQLPSRAEIARVPIAYRMADGKVQEARYHRAVLFGDVDGDGTDECVIGCYFEASAPSGGARDDRARILVFKRVGEHWTRLWTSPGLGYEFGRPRFNIEEVESGLDSVDRLQPPIQIVRVGERLAISYFAWSESPTVGGLPGVYRWTGSRWQNVSPQADRFSLQDLDGDGGPEVIAGTRRVGHGSGDDDVPRVYRWNGDRFAESSSRFPAFYTDLVRKYTERVKALESSKQTFPREKWVRAIEKARSLASAARSSVV